MHDTVNCGIKSIYRIKCIFLSHSDHFKISEKSCEVDTVAAIAKTQKLGLEYLYQSPK